MQAQSQDFLMHDFAASPRRTGSRPYQVPVTDGKESLGPGRGWLELGGGDRR